MNPFGAFRSALRSTPDAVAELLAWIAASMLALCLARLSQPGAVGPTGAVLLLFACTALIVIPGVASGNGQPYRYAVLLGIAVLWGLVIVSVLLSERKISLGSSTYGAAWLISLMVAAAFWLFASVPAIIALSSGRGAPGFGVLYALAWTGLALAWVGGVLFAAVKAVGQTEALLVVAAVSIPSAVARAWRARWLRRWQLSVVTWVMRYWWALLLPAGIAVLAGASLRIASIVERAFHEGTMTGRFEGLASSVGVLSGGTLLLILALGLWRASALAARRVLSGRLTMHAWVDCHLFSGTSFLVAIALELLTLGERSIHLGGFSLVASGAVAGYVLLRCLGTSTPDENAKPLWIVVPRASRSATRAWVRRLAASWQSGPVTVIAEPQAALALQGPHTMLALMTGRVGSLFADNVLAIPEWREVQPAGSKWRALPYRECFTATQLWPGVADHASTGRDVFITVIEPPQETRTGRDAVGPSPASSVRAFELAPSNVASLSSASTAEEIEALACQQFNLKQLGPWTRGHETVVRRDAGAVHHIAVSFDIGDQAFAQDLVQALTGARDPQGRRVVANEVKLPRSTWSGLITFPLGLWQSLALAAFAQMDAAKLSPSTSNLADRLIGFLARAMLPKWTGALSLVIVEPPQRLTDVARDWLGKISNPMPFQVFDRVIAATPNAWRSGDPLSVPPERYARVIQLPGPAASAGTVQAVAQQILAEDAASSGFVAPAQNRQASSGPGVDEQGQSGASGSVDLVGSELSESASDPLQRTEKQVGPNAEPQQPPADAGDMPIAPVVFISYPRVYVEYARLLAEALQPHVRVYFDLDLEAGDEWRVELEKMLEGADAVVAIAGPATTPRENPMREIRRAIELKKRLIPVLVDRIEGPSELLDRFCANTGPDGEIAYLANLTGEVLHSTVRQTAERIVSGLLSSGQNASRPKTPNGEAPLNAESATTFYEPPDQVSATTSSQSTRGMKRSDDKTVRLWDARSGQPIGAPMRGHEGPVWGVAFSPDGTRIVSGSNDKTLRLWNAKSGQPIGAPMRGHEGPVWGVAFSPDGTRIVSGSNDKTLRLWDAKSGQPISAMQGHRHRVTSVAFSPDGTRIVSGSADKTLRLWDAKSGHPIAAMQGHRHRVTSVAFSPEGTRIVSASDDKTLRLWDAESVQIIGAPMQGHENSVWSVVFSPDGTRIVSSSRDNTLRLWDAKSGQPIGTPMTGHEDSVWSVAFSPDGTRIVSGSGDKTLRLWDAKNGGELSALELGSGVRAVAWNGDSVVAGESEGALHVFSVIAPDDPSRR